MRFLSFLLLAAASDAKKEALAKKYKLDPQTVNELSDIDPTPNGEFCEWLAREASKQQLTADDLPAMPAMLAEFIKIKRNPQWTGEKNILNYKAHEFMEAMELASREDYSKKQKVRDIEENAKKYLADGVKYLGKTNGCYAYQVLTPVASAAMSKGTHWCTQSEGTSASYLSDGCIYVFTKPGFENSYKNDKYAQIYISNRRLEAETCEGKDLTSNSKFGLVYTEECMEFIKFLTQFNDALKKGVEEGDIKLREGSYTVCCNCDEEIDDEDQTYEADGDLYCESCYYDHYSSCEACGDTINMDNGDYVSTDNGMYCNDCGSYCQSCENGFRTTGRHAMSFYEVTNSRGRDESICGNCFNEGYFSCEECDENHPHDEGYEIDDERVCEDCFKTKWKEDTMNTLVAWAETDGNEEKIRKEVMSQAETEFEKHKEYLVGAEFKVMQENGYLFSWDDLDLATTVAHLSEQQKLQDKWKLLVSAVQDPIHFACETLADEIQENSSPTEGWSSDEVLEKIHENGVTDTDDNFTDCRFF